MTARSAEGAQEVSPTALNREDALGIRVTSGKGDGHVGLAIRKSPVRAKTGTLCYSAWAPSVCESGLQ